MTKQISNAKLSFEPRRRCYVRSGLTVFHFTTNTESMTLLEMLDKAVEISDGVMKHATRESEKEQQVGDGGATYPIDPATWPPSSSRKRE
jgi:hypothetical protein